MTWLFAHQVTNMVWYEVWCLATLGQFRSLSFRRNVSELRATKRSKLGTIGIEVICSFTKIAIGAGANPFSDLMIQKSS